MNEIFRIERFSSRHEKVHQPVDFSRRNSSLTMNRLLLQIILTRRSNQRENDWSIWKDFRSTFLMVNHANDCHHTKQWLRKWRKFSNFILTRSIVHLSLKWRYGRNKRQSIGDIPLRPVAFLLRDNLADDGDVQLGMLPVHSSVSRSHRSAEIVISRFSI